MREGEKGRRREGEIPLEGAVADGAPGGAVSSSPPFPFSLSVLAAVVALVGLGDGIYLTVHHLSGEAVPCSVVSGCELVLSSEYAVVAGVPLAALGALAYFAAFSLAVLSYFGNRKMWFLFGVQASLMAAFSVWLLYLQAFVIGAFCQFCLLSALVTFTLFVLAVVSKFWRFRPSV